MLTIESGNTTADANVSKDALVSVRNPSENQITRDLVWLYYMSYLLNGIELLFYRMSHPLCIVYWQIAKLKCKSRADETVLNLGLGWVSNWCVKLHWSPLIEFSAECKACLYTILGSDTLKLKRICKIITVSLTYIRTVPALEDHWWNAFRLETPIKKSEIDVLVFKLKTILA